MIANNDEFAIAEIVKEPLWNAVFSLALAVAALITAEFLPVSLLTPMARDLGITEGAAGQTISITAVAAMITSLLVTVLTQGFDRRWVLLSFCLLQISSNVLVVFAPSFTILLLGRVLLGIGLGGFWAMSAATAMRLVPQRMVPKALSIIFGALSIATVIAAPMGSFLGGLIGWRNVFLVAAAVGVIALIWQAVSLPSMRTEKPVKLNTLFHVLQRYKIKEGLLATMLIFIGYATFFTYLRPFLEQITGVNQSSLTAILFGFGISNFFGTTLARIVLEKSLKWSLIIVPIIMSMIVAALILFGQAMAAAAILIALWGLTFGIIQVAWPTWLTRTIPDQAESAGGIQVAAIQLAITLGAAIGGLIFDYIGIIGVYIGSSVITCMAGIASIFALKIVKENEI
ncbi:DHA1 family purine ribonucleoside efflux pump-like MFS transporter [Flavobacterium tiangeerense]|uniref:DHA1 family purine ribonucleoside efflux pump-like MFS transporter n=2 Tax=Flavobacterium tiangeerense TaxID=459471 RepID=A0ABY3FKQ6_9FLAO|nr:DHA1 family purine ribonucleoside efflux pump-like MFS transporter [Flavobacterium tiangeerense]